jgi:hypothetical protein
MRYLFILLILFSSCSGSWHIQRAEKLCPECFKSEVQIEYKDSIIYRDTIIELSFNDFLELDTTPDIRYEKVYIDNKIKILPTFDTIITEVRGLDARIWMNKGNLGYRFTIDSTTYYQLKDSISVLNKIITQTNTVKIEKQTPFKEYLLILVVILALGFLIVIFKKK